MNVEFRFAGYYRTLAGQSSYNLKLFKGATIEDALIKLDEVLEGRCHDLFFPENSYSTHPPFLLLVNTQVAERSTSLEDGNIVAIVPPMAGG